MAPVPTKAGERRFLRMGLVLDQILFKRSERYSTDEVFIRFVEAVGEPLFEKIQFCTRVRETDGPEAPYLLRPTRFEVLPLPWYGNIPELCLRGYRLFPQIRRTLARAIPTWDLALVCGIHPVTPLVLRIARRNGVPAVLWIRGDLEADLRHRLKGMRRVLGISVARLVLAMIPKGTPVVSVGRDDYRFLKRMGPVQIIYSSEFEAEDFVAPRSFDRSPRRSILYVGRIAPEKGLEVLLQALRLLTREWPNDPPTLTLVGSDLQGSSYGEEFRRRVEVSDLSPLVRHMGHVRYGQKLFDFYDAHDVLVLPSFTEGFPQVIFEAMARGLPVVATSVGGVPTFVRDGESGLLVPPGNAEALAGAIRRVLTDKVLASGLSREGQRCARAYTRTTQSEAVRAFLKRTFPAAHFASSRRGEDGGSGPPEARTFTFTAPEPSLDISVIIPVRNEIRYIGPCLDSVLGQRLKGLTLEVLVVDGMSTDGTREELQRRAKADPRVRLLDNPAHLVSFALNSGIRAARGRILVRMDAHSIYEEDYLKQCLAVLEETGADAVGGIQVPEPGAETRAARAIAAIQTTFLGMGGGKHRRPDYEGLADSLWLGAFHRRIMEVVGGFDETLFRTEENDFYQRLRAKGGRLWLSPRIRARYRCRPTLRSLAQQCYVTGTEIPRTIFRNPRAMAPRHLVPCLALLAGLVLSGLVLAGEGAWRSVGLIAGAATVAAYVGSVAFVSWKASSRAGRGTLPYILASFPLVHSSYGVGTVVGIAKAVLERLRSESAPSRRSESGRSPIA